MTEALRTSSGLGKEETYQELLPQIESTLGATKDLIANMANVSAMLKQAFDFHWVGFYRTVGAGQLLLGPFQGPLACVTIPFSKGVCGHAATTQKTVIVADVELFPGHIACSGLTRSEIVVPCVHDGETTFVLDVDSARLNDFDETDRVYLEKIVIALARACA